MIKQPKMIAQTSRKLNKKSLQACNQARELEDSGDYEKAAQSLGELWIDIGQKPDLQHFSKEAKAEVLVRIGALTGWLGSARLVEGAQEKAKDLISEGIRFFELQGNSEKVAEAQSDLGVCYWREGSFPEAIVFLEDALNKVSDKNFGLRGKILLRLVNVAISTRNFKEADELLEKAAPLIEKSGENLLLGKLHFHRALVFRILSEEEDKPHLIKAAVENYQKASHFYQLAQNLLYQGVVENNLGFLLLTIDKFSEAHTHLDTAINLFNSFNDTGRIALAYDAKARVFMAQNKLVEAELFAQKSVQLLSGGDEHSALSESMTTLAAILSRQEEFEKAQETFAKAAEHAEYFNDQENFGLALLTKLEELHQILPDQEKLDLYEKCKSIFSQTMSPAIRRRLEKAGELCLRPEPVTEWTNFSLTDEVLKFEAQFISKALVQTGGKVTKAAELLGLSHQNLSLMLKRRHKDLASIKKPRRRRSDRKKSKKSRKKQKTD